MSELLAQLNQPWLNITAMGLCGFMVWANWQDRRATRKWIESESRRMADLSERMVLAVRMLAQALHDRPCLRENGAIGTAGDSQVQPAIEGE